MKEKMIIELPRAFEIAVISHPVETYSYCTIHVGDIVKITYNQGSKAATDVVEGRVHEDTCSKVLVLDVSAKYQSKQISLPMESYIKIRKLEFVGQAVSESLKAKIEVK